MILNASQTGSGKALALLHGLFGRSQNFGALARRLSAAFRVISLDLRNHGESPHATGMSYAAMAEDVLETLAGITELPVALLGHSMGGKVAMVAALARPSAISRLLVADIAPISYRHSNRAVAASMLAVPLGAACSRAEADSVLAEATPDPRVRAFLLQNFVPGASPAWKIGLAHIAAGMADIEGFPPLPPHAQYRGPTLFVRGSESGYVKDAAWPVIRSLFPDAELRTIEGAGHWLHADQPEAFAESVETFFCDTP
jgi:pimeloyl-ACP methyl ester carboxylesterase